MIPIAQLKLIKTKQINSLQNTYHILHSKMMIDEHEPFYNYRG